MTVCWVGWPVLPIARAAGRGCGLWAAGLREKGQLPRRREP